MDSPTITLCLLNYYEDYLCCKIVSQCYPFVDEILIGDGSQGKDMLREFMKGCDKVKIIDISHLELRRGPKFDLSAICNEIQSHATSEWILWTEEDELYPYDILENLKTWIKQFPEAEAFGFIRCYPSDKWRNSWIHPDEPKIRLWKNNGKIKWSGIAHHMPTGFKSYQLIAEKYYHDQWLVSAIHQIYKYKDKETQGTMKGPGDTYNKQTYVEPYRNLYPESEREKRMRSRE